MKFLRYFAILALVFASVASVSCKKDEEDSSTSEYLSGTLSYDFPSYVNQGDEIHVVPTGVYKGDDEADSLLSVSWTNPFTKEIDTLRLESDDVSVSKEFDFLVADDTLGTFVMSVTVWADGYYSKTTTSNFVVVDPTLGTGSVKGYDFLSELSTFTDSRDGQTYYYNTVGGLDWMIQNLSWTGAGVSYAESDVMAPIFGQFYNWTEAATACPSGWRLPTNAEYKALAEAGGSKEDKAAGSMMEDATFNGDTMWEFWPDVKITNTSRFSALPVGYVMNDNGAYAFKGYTTYAMFWTADQSASSMGIARYIHVDKAAVYSGEFDKTGVYASVRCVR